MDLKKNVKAAYKEIKNVSLFKKEAHYFLIVSQERTGSTLLSDLISFHPSILIDRHQFYMPDTWPSHWREGQAIYSRKPVRGFKFKMTHTPLQADAAPIRQFFESTGRGMDIIRLRRENTFRQALSACLADLRDQLHAKSEEGSNPDQLHRVDPDELLERIQYFERLTHFQDRVLDGLAHHKVTYESDLRPQDRHQDTANRIFQHLGLEPASVKTRFRKMTPNRLSEIVSNPKELVDALSASPYADYLSSSELSIENV